MKELVMLIPCHPLPERCIHIKGKPMPICARCFAMILGYIFVPFLVIAQIHAPIWIPVLLTLPLLIDGFTQMWKWRTSNNVVRIITGLMFGLGQSVFISTVVWSLSDWMKTIS